MEISEDNPNENEQWLFIQTLIYSKRFCHQHLSLGEAQSQTWEWGSFRVKNGKASVYSDGEAEGRLARSGVFQ